MQSTQMPDLDLDFDEPTRKSPADLAAELGNDLRTPSAGPEPARKRGAHPKGCKCGRCKWSKQSGGDSAPPDSQQETISAFKLDPEIISPAIFGIGKRITEHYDVTPYQKEEARDVAKALSYCIEYLIKLWGLNPAYAPFAFLAILLIFQVGGRVLEYQILNDNDEQEPEQQTAIAIAP